MESNKPVPPAMSPIFVAIFSFGSALFSAQILNFPDEKTQKMIDTFN